MFKLFLKPYMHGIGLKPASLVPPLFSAFLNAMRTRIEKWAIFANRRCIRAAKALLFASVFLRVFDWNAPTAALKARLPHRTLKNRIEIVRLALGAQIKRRIASKGLTI